MLSTQSRCSQVFLTKGRAFPYKAIVFSHQTPARMWFKASPTPVLCQGSFQSQDEQLLEKESPQLQYF